MKPADTPLPLLHAGVDEAGRGPLAGPVVAAAVIPGEQLDLSGIRDSKKLSEKRRDEWYERITSTAHGWAIAIVDVAEIDELNILRASLEAMRRAVADLADIPQLVLVDGNQQPPIALPTRAIVGGDDIVPAISAASVLAKMTRDRLMIELDASYPQYGFARHKGYPTPQHLQALREHGPCPCHRRSFAPVKQLSLW
ncbi:MAG: ribonuclease HII [Wenzhouxiangellaceae bacterium]